MPDNFDEAFDVPVIEKIAGEDVAFPRLWIDDYTPWIAELRAASRKQSRALLVEAGITDPNQKYDALRISDSGMPGLFHISQRVDTPDGSKRVLQMSLALNAGVNLSNKEAFEAFKPSTIAKLRKLSPYRITELARDVSGLFKPIEKGGKSNPNAQTGSEETGSSTEPSATESPDTTQDE